MRIIFPAGRADWFIMLTYSSFMKAIRERRFFPIYLFYGEESYIQEELIRKLAKAYLGEEDGFGLEKADGERYSPDELLEETSESNIFSSRRLIVINDPPYMKPLRSEDAQKKGAAGKPLVDPKRDPGQSVEEKADRIDLVLESYLGKVNAASSDCALVFRMHQVDRRRRYFKLIDKHGAVVQCSPLKGKELSEWIKRKVSEYGKTIDHAAIEKIMMSGDLNLTFLRAEIEKFTAYLGGENNITAETVEQLFSGDLQSSVFTMLDALAEGSPGRARVMLDRLLQSNEKPLQILAMLFRHYRLLLNVIALENRVVAPKDMAALLGVPPFAATRLRRQASLYSSAILAEVIHTLYETDKKIKTGRLEPNRALFIALERINNIQKTA